MINQTTPANEAGARSMILHFITVAEIPLTENQVELLTAIMMQFGHQMAIEALGNALDRMEKK